MTRGILDSSNAPVYSRLRTKLTRWTAPWLWAPVIVFAAYNLTIGPIRFSAPYLLIPILGYGY